MLHEQIKNEIKEAMIAKDTVRLEVARSMVAAFMNELVAKGKKPNEVLNDEEVLLVISRMAKQRKDSIDQFTKGGRMDLVAEEVAQLSIIEKYLPRLMEEGEIREIVKNKKAESGITDPKEKGKFMAQVMQELKGKADGALVKKIVDESF